MIYRIICALFIATLSFCTICVAMAGDDYGNLRLLADKITAKMPNTWRVAEEKTDVIPEWHYEGLKYDGPRGLYLLLVGDRDVDFKWKDKDNIWHKEPIFKEAIGLWIMPSEYHQSWKRFFVFKGHVPTEKIYSGEKVKIYGDETTYQDPGLPDRFKEILPYALQTAGTPDQTVQSWIAWKEDIKSVLQSPE